MLIIKLILILMAMAVSAYAGYLQGKDKGQEYTDDLLKHLKENRKYYEDMEEFYRTYGENNGGDADDDGDWHSDDGDRIPDNAC